MKPLVLDLCCGLGGWSKAFLDEGWDAVGFDIERHEYGEKRYPGELILADVLKLNGYDLRAANPSLVVASPPCQRYSWMAMPFSRGKREASWQRWERDSPFSPGFHLNDLFNACFRIARELGVPIVLENVKGAQPWVGRARANYGSYYLWGDIANVGGRIVRPDSLRFGQPAVKAAGRVQKYNPDGTEHPQGSWFAVADSQNRGAQKREGRNFHGPERGESSPSFNGAAHETRSVKHGGDCFSDPSWPGKQGGATKGFVTGLGKGHDWRQDPSGRFNSKSDSRKAASALIAEIPYPLAAHIARVFKPW